MNKLKELVANILGLSPEQITASTQMDSLPTWDSFNSLLVVSELESTFKIKFSIEEIQGFANLEAIAAILSNHGIQIS